MLPEQKVPRWFTPLRLLIIFCATNLFVYLDRGLIASNGVNGSPPSEQFPEGSGIQGAFHLTYFQDGLLPAAFMIGLLISSPIFAEACKTANAFRLLALGMGVWTLACLGCAAAPNFGILMLSRALVGVGEASFVSLAAPFIDDWAPPKAKSQWFAAFYLCIPVGFAMGYIVATAQPLRLQGSEDKAHAPRGTLSALQQFWHDVKTIGSLPVWLCLASGQTCYVAVLGVFAFWGPQAGRQLFFSDKDAQSASAADLAFGGVTVLTGVMGSLAGGVALDRMGSTLRNASSLCAASNFIGFILVVTAFSATKTFTSFMVVFGMGQFALFCLQAPVAVMGMWCVPANLRPLCISLITVCIHAFGDVPSPPLLGLIQAKLSQGMSAQEGAQQWRLSMSLISMLLLASGCLFVLGAWLATPATDFRVKEREKRTNEGVEGVHQAEIGDEDDVSQLLLRENPAF
ncbi:hypothetical protein CEUSTIGMA_g2459.t1 [Chlamydomonas eustigma]|uniref:Major facilitator superfamily (MFS) profile domain-containing protein n=1 Tax=Chlamydomonas eustigma TaxID=1157962 RepID=A0A250WVY8_9CHLO|nr:hypothetical protein CEUSTIGMA_g2459.t1 [Chlamydomonas eustigma]|eukprot:GAX75013.1 hypothetical protein CEUSTIGMA_g2459.t1 [Chlamydomonas eustigma]